MSLREGAQHPIGRADIDGEAIAFLWGPGSGFVTAEFAERSPRGIANLTGLETTRPHVVPLSHKAWLTPERESALIEAGRTCLTNAIRDCRSEAKPESPAGPHRQAADDRNTAGPGMFNRHRIPARSAPLTGPAPHSHMTARSPEHQNHPRLLEDSMKGLASSSLPPDAARTQYLEHVDGCDRCKCASGSFRWLCRDGKALARQANDASTALIARAGGAS